MTASGSERAPRVVFDCPVSVQAFLGSGGASFACLELADRGLIELLVSRYVLSEVNDVLRRPALRRRRSTVTTARIGTFIEIIAGCATLVDPVPHVFDYERDPKDAPYVDLAVAGDARFLVSRDQDLLDLMDTETPDAFRFRATWPALTILDPPGLLRAISER